MNYWESVTVANIVYLLTIIVLLASFLEKVFDFEFFGRRLFRLLWRMVKFFLDWFLMPFKPRIDACKALLFAGKELEKRFLEFLESEKQKNEQLREIGDVVGQIKKEVTFNGGGSIKDAVFKLTGSDERKWKILNELRDCANLNSLRLDIADESDKRMSFKMDDGKRCTFISESFLRFFGFTERDMMGLDWDFCISPKCVRQVHKAWRTAYERRAPYRFDQIIVDSDGEEHRCLVRGFPLLSASGELTGYYGTVEILDEDEDF